MMVDKSTASRFTERELLQNIPIPKHHTTEMLRNHLINKLPNTTCFGHFYAHHQEL